MFHGRVFCLDIQLFDKEVIELMYDNDQVVFKQCVNTDRSALETHSLSSTVYIISFMLQLLRIKLMNAETHLFKDGYSLSFPGPRGGIETIYMGWVGPCCARNGLGFF